MAACRFRQIKQVAAGLACMTCVSACTASLPPAIQPLAPKLLDQGKSLTVAATPRVTYERIAGQAQKCWFGPFGSLRQLYIMHADVPPPSSSDPVVFSVHRRLVGQKKPWGARILKLELAGSAVTTLSYEAYGLPRAEEQMLTDGLTAWANNGTECPLAAPPSVDAGSQSNAPNIQPPVGSAARPERRVTGASQPVVLRPAQR